MISALLFDADGVVINSQPLWDKCDRAFVEKHGCAYDRDNTIPLTIGTSLVEGARIMQSIYGFPGDPERLTIERINRHG